jgi:hypothetical protein
MARSAASSSRLCSAAAVWIFPWALAADGTVTDEVVTGVVSVSSMAHRPLRDCRATFVEHEALT